VGRGVAEVASTGQSTRCRIGVQHCAQCTCQQRLHSRCVYVGSAVRQTQAMRKRLMISVCLLITWRPRMLGSCRASPHLAHIARALASVTPALNADVAEACSARTKHCTVSRRRMHRDATDQTKAAGIKLKAAGVGRAQALRAQRIADVTIDGVMRIQDALNKTSGLSPQLRVSEPGSELSRGVEHKLDARRVVDRPSRSLTSTRARPAPSGALNHGPTRERHGQTC
jgi:hypothetical protein